MFEEFDAFTNEEYVEYHDWLVNTAILTAIGLSAIAIGVLIGSDAIIVEEAGGWFRIDLSIIPLLWGAAIAALGVQILIWAVYTFRLAKNVRRMVQTRKQAKNVASTAFLMILAGTILRTLTEIKEADSDV